MNSCIKKYFTFLKNIIDIIIESDIIIGVKGLNKTQQEEKKMEFETLIEKVKEVKKGTFIHLEYKSEPKPLAAHKDAKIEKITNGTYRLGITYANLKSKKDKETGPMVWGQWEDNLENYIVTNTNKKGETKKYLRVYMAEGKKSVTKYLLNGIETTKEYLIANGYISDRKSQHIDCFTVAVENVIQVGAC